MYVLYRVQDCTALWGLLPSSSHTMFGPNDDGLPLLAGEEEGGRDEGGGFYDYWLSGAKKTTTTVLGGGYFFFPAISDNQTASQPPIYPTQPLLSHFLYTHREGESDETLLDFQIA